MATNNGGIGNKIISVLNQLNQGLNTGTEMLFGGGADPSAMDVRTASQPDIAPRGILGVLGSIGQEGARRRVAGKMKRDTDEASERARESHQVDIEYKRAQTEATKALAGQRAAQEKLTLNRVQTENKAADIAERAQNMKEQASQADIETQRRKIDIELNALNEKIRRDEIDAANIADDNRRAWAMLEIDKQKVAIERARAAADQAYKEGMVAIGKQRASTYQDIANAYGKSVTYTEQGTDIVFTDEAGNVVAKIPAEAAPSISQLMKVPGMAESILKGFGVREGLLGTPLGAQQPVATPRPATRTKTTQTNKTVATPQAAPAAPQVPANIPRTQGNKVLVIQKSDGQPGYVTPPVDTTKYTQVK